MSIVAFDTLKFANQLQAGNFTPEQAQAMTAAMVEAMARAELATKSDLVAVNTELKNDIAAVKAELKADIQASEHRLEKKIDSVIADVEAAKVEIKSDLVVLEQRTTIKLGGMLIVVTSVLLAAIRYLGH